MSNCYNTVAILVGHARLLKNTKKTKRVWVCVCETEGEVELVRKGKRGRDFLGVIKNESLTRNKTPRVASPFQH